MSLILKTDSYKCSHWKLYPPGTEYIYSYLESRGGDYPATRFFGLQGILKSHLLDQVTLEEVDEAAALMHEHLGPSVFNVKGWYRLVAKHGGHLPLRIRAVPEGTTAPVSNVLMTVENTDPEFPWLTNYAETILSQVWYPTTVATLSAKCRATIQRALALTGGLDTPDFKLHDFGYRGSTSHESAGIGGAAHLVNFSGSDTLAALLYLRRYYGATMPAHSIQGGAEHSTIQVWGKEHEVDAYRHILRQYPAGLVAVVSDTYDIYHACEKLWGEELREEVMRRNGVLIIRPDSGHPPTVVLKCLNILWDRFGGSQSTTGHRVLNSCVRLLQGDGVSPAMIAEILSLMAEEGWCADNITFGMGGALLQRVNRDTCRFAFKCSAAFVDGAWREVWKEPITDLGKHSKRGRLALVCRGGEWATMPLDNVGAACDILRTVYENGRLVVDDNLEVIRGRV